MNQAARDLADLVLIYFTKEELHPDEERETKDEMIKLAKEVERCG